MELGVRREDEQARVRQVSRRLQWLDQRAVEPSERGAPQLVPAVAIRLQGAAQKGGQFA